MKNQKENIIVNNVEVRLYVNMVKAGEAGGALEVILQRLADFKEKAQSLKRKITGAMIYPAVVIFVAVSILVFIMIFIKSLEEPADDSVTICSLTSVFGVTNQRTT